MKKLDKKIFSTLFFSIFGTVTGVGIVVPLLPVYAHDLGAGGLYIGLIFGAFSLSRTFFLPYFGIQSDKKGRKPFIVAGLFAYTLISLAFVWASRVEALIAIRFIQGIASAMIMPAVQAYVGDITPDGREGFTMGLFNMSMFLGLSVGPLIGGVIKDSFSLDISFASMGILTLAGFLLSCFLLPPTKTERVVSRGKKPLAWKWLLYNRDMAGIFLFRFGYAASIGVIWSFLPVLADLEFSLSSSSIGILVMLGVFSSGLIHIPMGFLADRINKKMMVVPEG
jgi:MFS family permease